MSSIADMVNFAFRKQIFNWLKKRCEDEDSDATFELYQFINPDTNHTYHLEVDFCDDNLIFGHWSKNSGEGLNIIYSKYFGDTIKKNPDEFKLTTLSCEIARFTRHFATNKNSCCEQCRLPLNFMSEILKINTIDEGSIINNLCNRCETSKFLKLNSKLMEGEHKLEEISCDICYEKCIEKVGDDKIKLTNLTIPTCCKGKYMCNECRKKQDEKCFFCRQAPKWEWLL